MALSLCPLIVSKPLCYGKGGKYLREQDSVFSILLLDGEQNLKVLTACEIIFWY